MTLKAAIGSALDWSSARASWAFLAFYSIILSLEWFKNPFQFSPIHFILIALLACLVLYKLISFLGQDQPRPVEQLEIGIGLLLSSRLAVQVSGGMDSALYPLGYLVFALLMAVLTNQVGAMLLIFMAGLELAILIHAGSIFALWPDMLGHVGFTAAFGGMVGLFVKLERRGKRKAQNVLEQLQHDANDFRTQDNELRELANLSKEDQEKQAVRSVLALDDVFLSVMGLVKKSMHGYTCALYWQERSGKTFHLREILSESEKIDDTREVVLGQGLLGYVAGERKPLHMEGHKKLHNNLLYYKREEKVCSALAAPVLDNNRVLGLLIVDSLEPDAFSRKDEKLLLSFAERVREAYQHALLLRKTATEAGKFKGLTELAQRLNNTLDMDEILSVVLRAVGSILAHDSVVVTLWNEDQTQQQVVTGEGEMAQPLNQRTFALGKSLVGWVIREKKYLYNPRLKERSRNIPIFAKRIDPKAAQSLLCYPLNMGDRAIGSLVLLGRTPNMFSPYEIQVAGLVANLAAAAVANSLMYSEMERRAITDGLTGLYNHRLFQERLSMEIERASRTATKLSVVLMDIDHFKNINDTHGHPIGDKVLKSMSKVVQEQVRKIDTAARYGGEEFVLILVGTDAHGALKTAERIRKAVAKLVFVGESEFSVTISLGIAAYPDDALKKEQLTERADQALYHAKEHGRNQVVLYSSLPSKIAVSS